MNAAADIDVEFQELPPGDEPAEPVPGSHGLRESPDAADGQLSAAIEQVVSLTRDAHFGELVSSAAMLCTGPGMEVAGAGLLPLPVGHLVFAELQRARGVAKCIEILLEPACLRFENPSWQGGRVPALVLGAVSRGFGIPSGACVATLRGLLITGPGGNVAHRICKDMAPGTCGA